VPIAGIAGDQQAALFGQACHAPGLAKNTYGTGCFLLLNTGSRAVASANNLVTTVAWQRDGTTDYALEGSIFMGGAVVQWLRDGLKIIQSAAQIEALASSVPDNGGVYLVPAFAGLGAPHWDAYARGAMFGLTRGATSAHIARAALEAIAFQSVDVLTAMQKDAGITLTELRVDGGATAKHFIEQMRATASELDQAGADCAAIAGRLRAAVDAYAEVIDFVVRESKGGDVRAVYAGSVPYLKLAGIVHGGWQMGRAALAAARRLAAGDDPEFHRAKIGTARFFADHMLVTATALAATATEGSAGTLALADEQF